MENTNNIDDLVKMAKAGDKEALVQVIRNVQDKIYHLALRFLANQEDGLDATQEILILITTRLSTFKGESAFSTWVYRVATNYLLTAKKIKSRELGLTFEVFRDDLHDGLSDDHTPEDVALLNELRISCTMAMLLCLNTDHRMAYILGDVMEFQHSEASEILEISPASFRQRLSRARKKVVDFTAQYCGLSNSNAACTCPKRLPAALQLGRVNQQALKFADLGGPEFKEVQARAQNIAEQLADFNLQTQMPDFNAPTDLASLILTIVEGDTPAPYFSQKEH